MRWLSVFAFVLVFLTFPAVGGAQEGTREGAGVGAGAVVYRDEFSAAIERLQAQIDDLSRTTSELKDTADNNTFRLGQLAQKLETDLKTLQAAVDDAIAGQKEILDAISQQSSTGQYLPRLAANMANTEFAEEMKTVVNRSIPKNGTLRITNRSSWHREIWINEKYALRIQAGATEEVTVPAGTVTTRLPGQNLVTWTVGPPTNLQAIDIIDRQPSSSTVTYRWTQPVTVIYP